MLPTTERVHRAARNAGFEVLETHAFGTDYARTLALWGARFNAALPAVRALGFDERFERLWTFYLAYCEAGFLSRATDVAQFLLRRA
jgi:cyclopropane-fatty-acyl-phospholipid synthase